MSTAAEALRGSSLEPPSVSAPAAEPAEFAWRILILLNVFRLTIGLLLLAVFVLASDLQIVGQQHPGLAWLGLTAMIGVGTAEFLLLRRRFLDTAAHAHLQFTADLVIVTVLMHASGGLSSGLGGLLIVSVGTLGLMISPRRAFFLAALTALAILSQQTFAHLEGMTDSAQYAPAGILGAVAFVITAVVQLVRSRMLESEALAEQRGVDLRNLAQLSEYIVQHLRESIVVVDDRDCVRLLNESAGKHLGAVRFRTGAPLAEISPELARRLAAWRQHAEPVVGALPGTFNSADGSTTIAPHFAPLGRNRRAGVLIFLEDTSLIAERVQQSKLAALGRLSASIAHEIRNPLGAMSHAGQLLAESDSIAEQDRRLTDIIRVNSNRVSQIVESVLTVSRRAKASPERLQIRPWMEDFAREFVETLELDEGAVALVNGELDVEAEVDPMHLHQILWNLCDNAVKYASAAAGAIAVELSCGRIEMSGRPYLEVADRGPGIPPDKADEVFEPFFTGQPGGTGLGLYISRELCERNSAFLRYHPREGGGSVFRIVFADPERWQPDESAA